MKQGGTLSDIARAAGRHRSTISSYKGRPWFDCHQLHDGSWDVAGAAEAIKQNVNVIRQFSADCRRRDRPEPEQLCSGRHAIYFMHQAAGKTFGVSFDDAVDHGYTLEQMQARVTEGLGHIMDALECVACQEDPVKAAARAVVMTLAACSPFAVGIDVERFDIIVDEMKTIGRLEP